MSKRRRDIRLSGYDYSTSGTYFITICAQNRACIFGDVANDQMVLNGVGTMIATLWAETDRRFDGAESDAYVIMPDHFHALVRSGWSDGSSFEERFANSREAVSPIESGISTQSRHGGLQLRNSETVPSSGVGGTGGRHRGLHLQVGEVISLPGVSVPAEGRHGGLQRRRDEAVSLSKVVQWFKSATTTAYAQRVASDGWPRFPGRLWQQNYFEHIIRNDEELDQARAYITGNPGRWSEDNEYRPVCPGF